MVEMPINQLLLTYQRMVTPASTQPIRWENLAPINLLFRKTAEARGPYPWQQGPGFLAFRKRRHRQRHLLVITGWQSNIGER
jgi:hypothetical protein